MRADFRRDHILDAVAGPAAPMPRTAAGIRAAAEAAGTKLYETTRAVFALTDRRAAVRLSGDAAAADRHDRETAAGYRNIRRQTLRLTALERMLLAAVERDRSAAG